MVCRSVPPLLFWRFRRFASGFSITAPAQLYVTDAVVCMALHTAPALPITAPAQPLRLGLSLGWFRKNFLAFERDAWLSELVTWWKNCNGGVCGCLGLAISVLGTKMWYKMKSISYEALKFHEANSYRIWGQTLVGKLRFFFSILSYGLLRRFFR